MPSRASAIQSPFADVARRRRRRRGRLASPRRCAPARPRRASTRRSRRRSAFGSYSTSAASASGTLCVAMTATCLSVSASTCFATATMFLLLGSTITASAAHASTASRICAVDGFIDWPPATTCCTPRLVSRRRMPSPTPTATTAVVTAGWSPNSSRSATHLGLAHPALLFDLLDEVGDADLVRAARVDAGFDRGADVVRVDVAVPEAVAADDDDRVADRAPRVAERRASCRRARRAGTSPRSAGPRRRRPRGARRPTAGVLTTSGSGIGAAVDDFEQRVEQQREALAARVDDTRVAQRRAGGAGVRSTASHAASYARSSSATSDVSPRAPRPLPRPRARR